jgi:hypothetical protein
MKNSKSSIFSDITISIIIAFSLVGSLTAAGVVLGNLNAITGYCFLVIAQFISAPYAMAIISGHKKDKISISDLYTSFFFRLASILVLPFFLQGTYRVFGEQAFVLQGTSDTSISWVMFALDQMLESVLLGLPALYKFQLSSIIHQSPLGSTVLLLIRLLVIALFISFIKDLIVNYRSKHKKAVKVEN